MDIQSPTSSIPDSTEVIGLCDKVKKKIYNSTVTDFVDSLPSTSGVNEVENDSDAPGDGRTYIHPYIPGFDEIDNVEYTSNQRTVDKVEKQPKNSIEISTKMFKKDQWTCGIDRTGQQTVYVEVPGVPNYVHYYCQDLKKQLICAKCRFKGKKTWIKFEKDPEGNEILIQHGVHYSHCRRQLDYVLADQKRYKAALANDNLEKIVKKLKTTTGTSNLHVVPSEFVLPVRGRPVIGRQWTLGYDRSGVLGSRLFVSTPENPEFVHVYSFGRCDPEGAIFYCTRCRPSRKKHTYIVFNSDDNGNVSIIEHGIHMSRCPKSTENAKLEQENFLKFGKYGLSAPQRTFFLEIENNRISVNLKDVIVNEEVILEQINSTKSSRKIKNRKKSKSEVRKEASKTWNITKLIPGAQKAHQNDSESAQSTRKRKHNSSPEESEVSQDIECDSFLNAFENGNSESVEFKDIKPIIIPERSNNVLEIMEISDVQQNTIIKKTKDLVPPKVIHHSVEEPDVDKKDEIPRIINISKVKSEIPTEDNKDGMSVEIIQIDQVIQKQSDFYSNDVNHTVSIDEITKDKITSIREVKRENMSSAPTPNSTNLHSEDLKSFVNYMIEASAVDESDNVPSENLNWKPEPNDAFIDGVLDETTSTSAIQNNSFQKSLGIRTSDGGNVIFDKKWKICLDTVNREGILIETLKDPRFANYYRWNGTRSNGEVSFKCLKCKTHIIMVSDEAERHYLIEYGRHQLKCRVCLNDLFDGKGRILPDKLYPSGTISKMNSKKKNDPWKELRPVDADDPLVQSMKSLVDNIGNHVEDNPDNKFDPKCPGTKPIFGRRWLLYQDPYGVEKILVETAEDPNYVHVYNLKDVNVDERHFSCLFCSKGKNTRVMLKKDEKGKDRLIQHGTHNLGCKKPLKQIIKNHDLEEKNFIIGRTIPPKKKPNFVVKCVKKKHFDVLIAVPEDQWIIPCDSNNVMKGKLFITNHRTYAVISYQGKEIFVDAQWSHIAGCRKVNLKEVLKNETGVLTNF